MRLSVLIGLLLCLLPGNARAQAPDADAYAKERLTTIARTNWPKATAALAAADEHAKAGRHDAARGRYRAARASAEVVRDTFQEFLGPSPHLGTFVVPLTADGAKTASATNLLATALETVALAKDKEAALASGAKAEVDADRAAAIASLKGDRKKVFESHGKILPASWEGSTATSTKKKLDALSTSATWDYVWSTPCTITYRWKGNKLAKTEHQPAGCKP